MAKRKVLVVSKKGDPGMLGSYGRALEALGFDVAYFDFAAAVRKSVRFGVVGQRFSAHVPVETWVRKANRELLIEALDTRPSLLLWAATMPIRAGTLVQLKVSRPETQVVHAWPDPMLNLSDAVISALRVCDLVACYSAAAVPWLERLAGTKVEWVPFGVDSELFPDDVVITDADKRRFGCDIGFVGNHRPEREEAILRLLDAGFSVKVWAASWSREARDSARAKTYYQGEPLFGRDVVKAMRVSTISLNVIDDANYPAANMRFFETYACGGVPLCSRAPEVEGEFPDGAAAVYFDKSDLVARARALLADAALRQRIAARGRELALAKHTYAHRARQIVDALSLTS